MNKYICILPFAAFSDLNDGNRICQFHEVTVIIHPPTYTSQWWHNEWPIPKKKYMKTGDMIGQSSKC